jgi:hypothetical protein
LLDNQDYTLAVPSSSLLEGADVRFDESLIQEHILELSFDKKVMTSMKGATYEVQGDKSLKRIKLTKNLTACEVLILSSDVATLDEK